MSNIDKTAMLKGWLIGRKVAGMMCPAETREPIAFLYNGAILPKLPEWNINTYPYAYIGYTTVTLSGKVYYRYYLYLTDQPFKIRASKTAAPDLDASAQIYFATPSTGEWQDQGTDTLTADSAYHQPQWADYDIYYMDNVAELGGTRYLAASEPVPIYE